MCPSFRDLILECTPAFHIEDPPVPEPFASKHFMLLLVRAKHQCPVVQMSLSANPGWNVNPVFFFLFLSKALSLIIFSIIFRVSDQQIVGKESFTEFDF